MVQERIYEEWRGPVDHPAIPGVIPPPPMPRGEAHVCLFAQWCTAQPTETVWVPTPGPARGYWGAFCRKHKVALFGEESESDDREQHGGDEDRGDQDR